MRRVGLACLVGVALVVLASAPAVRASLKSPPPKLLLRTGWPLSDSDRLDESSIRVADGDAAMVALVVMEEAGDISLTAAPAGWDSGPIAWLRRKLPVGSSWRLSPPNYSYSVDYDADHSSPGWLPMKLDDGTAR